MKNPATHLLLSTGQGVWIIGHDSPVLPSPWNAENKPQAISLKAIPVTLIEIYILASLASSFPNPASTSC